jgi:hypothetical protein
MALQAAERVVEGFEVEELLSPGSEQAGARRKSVEKRTRLGLGTMMHRFSGMLAGRKR